MIVTSSKEKEILGSGVDFIPPEYKPHACPSILSLILGSGYWGQV